MRPGDAVALRCRPVWETPIYEQLRGERINADVPPTETALPRVGRPGRHRQLADTTGPVPLYAPPGSGADLVAAQHPIPGIPDQSPGATQRTAVWGPRATLPRQTHARQTPLPASSPPTTTSAYDPAQAAGGDTVGPAPVVRARQNQRSHDPPIATSQGQFPWFDAGYGIRD